jgi:hypothetical protein
VRSARTTAGCVLAATLLCPVADVQAEGAYGVGFEELRLRDGSRSFSTLGETGRRSRPVTVALWYPASRDAAGPRIRVHDLLRFEAQGPRVEPPEAARVAAREARLKGALDYLYPGRDHGADLPRILALETRAVRGATPAPGRFPLVVLGPDPVGGTLLADLLTSHGYAVAVPVLLGYDREDLGLDLRTVETMARDHEFLVGALRERSFVDPGRTGAIQFSLGMASALIVQMRNRPFDVLVSLDGWDGMVRGSSPFADRRTVRAPYLRLVPGNDRFGADRTEALFETIRYAERTRLTFPRLGHSDLISLGVLAHPESEETQRGYAAATRVVLAFLDAHLKGHEGARSLLAGLETTADAIQGVFTVERRPALPAPPTEAEIEAKLRAGRLDEATRLIRGAREHDPDIALVRESSVNALGYERLRAGRVDEAIALLRLNAEMFPRSANAQDSLGEALAAAGRAAEAVACYRRALELDPKRVGAREALARLEGGSKPAGR